MTTKPGWAPHFPTDRRGNGHLPTADKRRFVRNLAGLGVTVKDIARMIEIDYATLMKHYPEDVEAGRAEANLKVSQSMFKAATREHNPNVVAGMFWLKNRAGWKDIAGGTGPGGNALHLHLTAAREIGKQILELQQSEPGPIIQHEPQEDSNGHAVNPLDAPPPLE